tara:strand:- start:2860 stop:5328 length:2469 start_codon:yes stop_codon:yes gene_type:complete
MAEGTEDTQPIENTEENTENDAPAEELSPKEDEEISADELGIDLDSLVLPDKTVLGGTRKSSTLDSGEKKPVGRPKGEDLSLFNWCEKFNYSPGIDYVELHRLYPKMWEGLSIGGFVERLYEPMDEESISDRWGGGSYQFKAHQRDATGRNRIVDQKFLEISGIPAAYRGDDGERRPFFNDRARSTRSDDVLRRRMSGLGRFRERDEEEEPRRNIDRPLVDASSLYKVQQGAKQAESDALGVLRQAQQDAASQMQQTAARQEEMYKTLLGQQDKEIERIRHEAKEQGAPFREMMQLLISKGDDGASRAQLEELRRMHENSISNLRESQESRIASLQDELNRQRMEYSTQVERARSDYLQKEQGSKEEAFRQYQAQLESIRIQHGEVREHHRDEVSSLRTEMAALRAEFQQRELTLRDEHRATVDKLQRSLDKAELAARQDRTEYESKIRDEFRERFDERERFHREHYENKLENLREQLSAKEAIFQERQSLMQQQSQQERETQRLLIESANSTREAVTQAHTDRLEAQLKDAQAAMRKLEKQVETSGNSGDPFSQLERLEAIKSKLREHGFVSDGEEKEEKEEEPPKDFLGKVVHYGPQILGPILQRVDHATAIAQQAVQNEQRRGSPELLEHQQNLLRSRQEAAEAAAQRQQAAALAQQRENELQQRRQVILQRRAEREAQRLAAEQADLEKAEVYPQPEPILEPQVAPEPTPVPAVEPESVEIPEVLQPVQEEEEMSQDSDPFAKLAQFIATEISQGSGSKAMIFKLKMAESTGIFPKSARLAVVSEPFEDLHTKLVAYQPSLRTPKARAKALAVYKGLK